MAEKPPLSSLDCSEPLRGSLENTKFGGSQSVVLAPVPATSPGNLYEMQDLRLHLRLFKPETLTVRPAICVLTSLQVTLTPAGILKSLIESKNRLTHQEDG